MLSHVDPQVVAIGYVFIVVCFSVLLWSAVSILGRVRAWACWNGMGTRSISLVFVAYLMAVVAVAVVVAAAGGNSGSVYVRFCFVFVFACGVIARAYV
jgi:hypothetical protein